MSDVKTLHDEDLVAWSKQQADALRAAVRDGSNQLLDWENLAEEDRRFGHLPKSPALHSQLRQIIQRLLKLEIRLRRAVRRRGGWCRLPTPGNEIE